ncbi:MAG: MarR family transcriptional regulator [Actinobacteria bacterium]|nr:MarR family transcriptional regulator [Actinomycetota bacterium]
MADRLHSVALHLSRRLRTEGDELGLSPPRLSALSVVVDTGPISVGELASTEGVTPPTMSRLVDGRTVRVRATPAGIRALSRGRSRRTFVDALVRLSLGDLRALDRGVRIIEEVLRSGPQP